MRRNVFRITITAFAAAILIATIGVLACSPTTTPTPTPDYYYIKGTRYVSGPSPTLDPSISKLPGGFHGRIAQMDKVLALPGPPPKKWFPDQPEYYRILFYHDSVEAEESTKEFLREQGITVPTRAPSQDHIGRYLFSARIHWTLVPHVIRESNASLVEFAALAIENTEPSAPQPQSSGPDVHGLSTWHNATVPGQETTLSSPADTPPTSTVVPTTAKAQATAHPDNFHTPQEKPTPTGKTLSEQIKEYEFPTKTGVDPIIDHQFQQNIDAYMAKKADRDTRGLTTEPEIVHVHIFSESPEDLDRHVQFIRDNGATEITVYRNESTAARANGLTASIRIDLIEEVGRLPGVEFITPVEYSKPLGSLRQSNASPAAAVRAHGASTWHNAGITATH